MSHQKISPKIVMLKRLSFILLGLLSIVIINYIRDSYNGWVIGNDKLVNEVVLQRQEIERLSQVISLTNYVELTNITEVVVTNRFRKVETNTVLLIETNMKVIKKILGE